MNLRQVNGRITPSRLVEMPEPVDLAHKLSLFSEHWSPKVVARLNDYEIKLAKLKGEFVWHTHDDSLLD